MEREGGVRGREREARERDYRSLAGTRECDGLRCAGVVYGSDPHTIDYFCFFYALEIVTTVSNHLIQQEQKQAKNTWVKYVKCF